MNLFFLFNRNESYTYNAKGKKPKSKEYILYSFIYTKFKDISNLWIRNEDRNEDSGYLWGGQGGNSRVVSGCWSRTVS